MLWFDTHIDIENCSAPSRIFVHLSIRSAFFVTNARPSHTAMSRGFRELIQQIACNIQSIHRILHGKRVCNSDARVGVHLGLG